MHTFFALTRVPKAQQAGDGGSRFVEKTTRQAPTWKYSKEPIYKSEIEVTRAIAAGTFQAVMGLAETTDAAYRIAKEWEKYQKLLNQKGFKPNAPKPRPNGSHNFVLMGGK